MTTQPSAIKPKTIQVFTEDRYPLSALIYTPMQPIHAKLIMACATGVPQLFYRRFAEFMSAHAYEVITFDYRGIGLSAPLCLKNVDISYLDWGKHDLRAMIDYASSSNPTDLPIFLIGHSLGGQAFGLTNNHHKITAMLCFGTGAGWSGYMPLREKIKIHTMWKMVFPPLVAAYGYLPWSKLNMGCDIPKSVYNEWKRWCKHPTYFFADQQHTDLAQQFEQVTNTIYAYSATDDDWALPPSRHAFMQHYRNADLHYIDLKPQDYALKRIGHMGYFRQGSEKIWQDILKRLEKIQTI